MLLDPTSPSCLKTLAFLNCAIPEGFIAKLAQFASERKNTTSASLYHVAVIGGNLSTADSIMRLREHVPVVEVVEEGELPRDPDPAG